MYIVELIPLIAIALSVRCLQIIVNPPYQEMGGSGGSNDAPVYQYFALSSSQVHPRYISLIIPARWFSGGRENLLGDFRKQMLSDHKVRSLVTYANSRDVFPSVEIKGGLCYYLWDSDYDGMCSYTIIDGNVRSTTDRSLDEFDVLIKYPILSEIVKKVMSTNPETVDSIISSDTPFGIGTNPKGSKKSAIKVFQSCENNHNTALFYIDNGKRLIEYVDRRALHKNESAIDLPKVFIPKGYGAGESFPHQILGVPEYGGPNSVCSQSYLYAAFNSDIEAKNFIDYLKTKFFRALVLSVKISQDAMSRTYRFVPMQDFSKSWTDTELYEKYGLTVDEIAFVEAMIKPME